MLNTGISLQRLATKAGVGFTPKKLFSNGEAGVWYDPSDVEASLTWRRNLLEYTESFDVSPWQKVNIGGTGISVIPSTHQAPDGSYNGVQILGLDTNQDRIDQSTGMPAVANKTYTYSVWLRGGGVIKINVGSSTGVGGSAEATVNLTSTWTRYSVTNTFNSAPTGNLRVHGVITRYTGTAPEVHAFGAQLEEGSTATEYQPIRSTFDNAFKQAFPKHTLYQDDDGGTPVTGLGQAVGLMLDKSEGVAFGDELVTNGDFSNGTTGWISTGGATATVSNNTIEVTWGGSGASQYYQAIPIVIGKTYYFSGKIDEVDATSSLFRLSNGANLSLPPSSTEEETITAIFTATTNTLAVGLRVDSAGSCKFSDISVKEIQGSHATQSDSTKRPVFARHPERGRVNLFKYTEEFDNGYWTKGGATTITANYSTAPDGTQTADRMVAPLAAGTYCVRSIPVTAGTNYVFSLYARATSGTDNIILSSPQVNTDFALDTDWKRISVTWTAPVTTNIDLTIDNGASAMDVLIWGAQLEEANEATGYQKVVDDYDITESGFRSVYYLQFDGVNDSMKVNNLTSSATPLTALLGYSKQNMDDDYSYLFDIETGRTVIGTGSTANYLQIYDTTNSWQGYATTGEIQVATFKMYANDASIRKNGLEEFTTSSYVIAPIGGQVGLFSGNNGNSAYSQGNLYQCVVRAATSTDKEIDQAEEFVAIKTGLKSEVVGLATLDLNFGANTYTARNSNGSVL